MFDHYGFLYMSKSLIIFFFLFFLKVYFQKFASSENNSLTKPVFKHKGLKACKELSEATFRDIFENDSVHTTTQAELSAQQYRIFAAEVGWL